MPPVAQTDEIELEEVLLGLMRARRRDLGTAAGSVEVGLVRGVVEPGARSTPQHRHGREQEFVSVLGGSGLSWQDDATSAIGPGDCLVHRVNEEPPGVNETWAGTPVVRTQPRPASYWDLASP